MLNLLNVIIRHDLIAPCRLERGKNKKLEERRCKKDGIYCMQQQPRASEISKNTDSDKMQKKQKRMRKKQ